MDDREEKVMWCVVCTCINAETYEPECSLYFGVGTKSFVERRALDETLKCFSFPRYVAHKVDARVSFNAQDARELAVMIDKENGNG
jgi:hypothetical protein